MRRRSNEGVLFYLPHALRCAAFAARCVPHARYHHMVLFGARLGLRFEARQATGLGF